MGRGGYLGGSTIIRAWGGQASRAKTNVGPIDLDAHLKKKPKKQKASKKAKRAKLSAEELAAERKARAVAEDAQGKVVVETRSARQKKSPKGNASVTASAPGKGNGLTIAEQVAKAEKWVRAVEADVARARQKLGKLDRQLAEARKQLDRAKNLPRRSALGQALAKAIEPEPQT